ncbi:hypothetical protein BDF22DRAFT_488797 [Syncephalis plumigaleata]|nr:hypothetical protein BDF22DRAFT_488797 [Syncephalis plumigaleata]
MPFIDYSNPEHTEWVKNAEKKNGISFHPLGEISMPDFYMEATGDIVEQRGRLMGLQFELIIAVAALYLFGRNLVKTCNALVSRPHALPLWFSFISAFFGTAIGFVFILLPLTEKLNCRKLVWAESFGMSISMLCNSTILLYKAYLVLYKRKWILYVGIPLIIPQIGFAVLIVFYSFYIAKANVGCLTFYPEFIIWYWASVNTPHNILFSVIFCFVTYKQYKILGSDIWRRLAREGIQTMSLALLCNILSTIIIVFFPSTINKDILLLVDCQHDID